jgi:hypothetical protein
MLEVLTLKKYHNRQRLIAKYEPIIEALKHKPYYEVAAEFGIGITTAYKLLKKDKHRS